ncbi:selenocysteine-specific translation elongation factor [Mesorhizobium sp. M1143]|uniref:selenocysteine-specific translation elongation factor n=1 Tax=Mesorhizobium sp. M1143 TaxID=2957061 RepID=UPI003336DA45
MIIGTAGHVNHGKTAVIRALTGVDTDRLKEEKARGITIDLGFAYLSAPDGAVLGFIDVPGHERFVRNMLVGATGIDFVLLVVAADDGIMPQTLEHLSIVDLLGIEHGIVALTKTDLALDVPQSDIVSKVQETLEQTSIAGAKIVPVSTITGEGISQLRNELFLASADHKPRRLDGRFRMTVDRSFTLSGTGTVVTGTVLSGAVSMGDHVCISPSGLGARIRSIHAQNRPVEHANAGERCALNLSGDGVTRDAVSRGSLILAPELHAPTTRIDATLRLLRSETKQLRQWTPVRLHHAAADVGARVVLLGEKSISPGEEALVQLVLDHPIASSVGDRFIVRDTSSQRTLAGGRFLDLRPPMRRRRTPERLKQLEANAIENPSLAFAALLRTPPLCVHVSVFARDRALGETELEAILDRNEVIRAETSAGTFAISIETWIELKQSSLAILKAFHINNPDAAGIGIERLRLQLDPRLPAPAFRSIVQGMVRSGDLVLDGTWLRLPEHRAMLTTRGEQVWGTIRPLLDAADRFCPPRVRDIAGLLAMSEHEVRRLLKLVGRMGKVHEVDQDHFFLTETLAEILSIATKISLGAPKGEFTVASLRDRLDIGRKVTVKLLEFFDRHGVTLRRGDFRRMNIRRLDLFRIE